LLVSSASSRYPRPGRALSYYLNGKALEEHALSDVLRDSNVTVTLLRPTFITGPLDPTTAPVFRTHAALPLGTEPTWQFAHEDDVAAAVELALRVDLPGAYNVVPDDSVTAREALHLLARHRRSTDERHRQSRTPGRS
jgi:nucleoside-diphosphate-sugar epimerase